MSHVNQPDKGAERLALQAPTPQTPLSRPHRAVENEGNPRVATRPDVVPQGPEEEW